MPILTIPHYEHGQGEISSYFGAETNEEDSPTDGEAEYSRVKEDHHDNSEEDGDCVMLGTMRKPYEELRTQSGRQTQCYYLISMQKFEGYERSLISNIADSNV